jgi:hypothetical protein
MAPGLMNGGLLKLPPTPARRGRRSRWVHDGAANSLGFAQFGFRSFPSFPCSFKAAHYLLQTLATAAIPLNHRTAAGASKSTARFVAKADAALAVQEINEVAAGTPLGSSDRRAELIVPAADLPISLISMLATPPQKDPARLFLEIRPASGHIPSQQRAIRHLIASRRCVVLRRPTATTSRLSEHPRHAARCRRPCALRRHQCGGRRRPGRLAGLPTPRELRRHPPGPTSRHSERHHQCGRRRRRPGRPARPHPTTQAHHPRHLPRRRPATG